MTALPTTSQIPVLFILPPNLSLLHPFSPPHTCHTPVPAGPPHQLHSPCALPLCAVCSSLESSAPASCAGPCHSLLTIPFTPFAPPVHAILLRAPFPALTSASSLPSLKPFSSSSCPWGKGQLSAHILGQLWSRPHPLSSCLAPHSLSSPPTLCPSLLSRGFFPTLTAPALSCGSSHPHP